MATVVRERKYDPATAGTAALEAVKAMTRTAGVAAVSQQAEQLLDAVYYDTADLRLIGAGITLRRRTGGDDAGWHLKLPASADTRDEIRLPLAAPGGKPAAGAASGAAGKRAVPSSVNIDNRACAAGGVSHPRTRTGRPKDRRGVCLPADDAYLTSARLVQSAAVD